MSNTNKPNTFLAEVADYLMDNHATDLGACTVVFPNRRAGMFLKKHLSRRIDKPVWAPEILSLEDFLQSFSTIKKTDPLTLVFELYEAFRQHQPHAEGFEHFYFWGEMLLRDFEEVDHYLVNPTHLFHHIKSDRELMDAFPFLDEDQEKIIRSFWHQFFPTATRSQEQFVETWRILAPVYTSFKERLQKENTGYTAHIYRQLVDHVASQKLDWAGPVIFAGFNALTPAEERLIKYFVSEHAAEMLWDLDAYYLDNPQQEAGAFLRKYRHDTVLGKTFPKELPSRLTAEKAVSVTGVALEMGQAKALSEKVAHLVEKEKVPLEEIVIVLPQDYMLFPVLNVIPASVEKLNVTMGYPLKDTPLYGLLEAALEVQEHKQMSSDNGLSFYHKPSLDVLSHPYLYLKERKDYDEFIATVRKENRIRLFHDELEALGIPVVNAVFRELKAGETLAGYLGHVVELLGSQTTERMGLEREYLYHFQQLLARLEQILAKQTTEVDLKTFKALFRKAARSVKMPFSGEPVEGLQVMGVLETRNLDFRHVFMVNMNEDIFPSSQRQGSFIPYGIRKAFALPTFETQDAIYAYLFYRLFHRAEHLSFYYNMYADFGMSGEVSRFLRQLELESPLTIQKYKLSNSVHSREVRPITIQKTDDIIQTLLDSYGKGNWSKLSASALNNYFSCRLKFYFKYVLKLHSKDDLTDDLDARRFGNVMHHTIEYLYADVLKNRPDRVVNENDFFNLTNSIDGAMEKAFRKEYGIKDGRRFALKDRHLVMGDIIRKYVAHVLEMDKRRAPFRIVSMEKEDNYLRILDVEVDGKTYELQLYANIDRVDQKEGAVRVLDYKSGRDESEVKNLDLLFQRSKDRNKAAFQTMYYAWLYASKHGTEQSIVPGLMNIQELFRPGFDERLTLNGEPIADARFYLPEFETRLRELLAEIFGMEQPFDQTEETKTCEYCDFRHICGR